MPTASTPPDSEQSMLAVLRGLQRAPGAAFALVDSDLGSIRFSELLCVVTAWVRKFRALATPGDVVALDFATRVDAIAAVVAALTAGLDVTEVPPGFGTDQIGRLFSEMRPALVVAEREASPLRQWSENVGVPLLEVPDARDGDYPIRDGEIADSPGRFVFFTSGTTGLPKAVLHSVRIVSDVPYGDRFHHVTGWSGPFLLWLTPGHQGAALAIRALARGRMVVTVGPSDMDALVSLIARHNVESAFLYTPALDHLFEQLEGGSEDVTTLREIAHGGVPCPVDTKMALVRALPRVSWTELYGSTEVSGVTSISIEDWLRHPGSVGQVDVGVEMDIVDANGGSVPQGDVGYIFVKRPASEVIVPDDFEGLRTGDLGYFDEESFLYLVGRDYDAAIDTHGNKLFPAPWEAKAALVEGVRDAVVLQGIEKSPDATRLTLVVEPRAGYELQPAVLREAVGVLPKPWVLGAIVIRGMPRTESGKIARAQLARELAEQLAINEEGET